MTIDGAVIEQQGVTFAVVAVQRSVLQAPGRTREFIDNFSPLFPGIPVVLFAQSSGGVPSIHGRKEYAKFLAEIPSNTIPWKKFTLR